MKACFRFNIISF